MKLTKEEIKIANKDENKIAQMLVRKAIEKEIAEKGYTEEEKKQIEEMKKNVEIEYYLNKIAQKEIIIYDYELLEVYKNNINIFGEKRIEEVTAQLKQIIYNQKLMERKNKIIEEIIEKYKLNDEIKEYLKK